MSREEHPIPIGGKWGYYVLAKLLQNSAKFTQKMTPGFKNHMKNLDNFRQAVESPKSSNSMSYIFPKNAFLQLKHYIQRIYLTLLSTTCVKIHQIPYVIFETRSYFSDTARLYYFSSNITYFWQKYSMKIQIFRFSTTKYQSSHVIFQTKSEFFFKVKSLFSVMRDNSSALF